MERYPVPVEAIAVGLANATLTEEEALESSRETLADVRMHSAADVVGLVALVSIFRAA